MESARRCPHTGLSIPECSCRRCCEALLRRLEWAEAAALASALRRSEGWTEAVARCVLAAMDQGTHHPGDAQRELRVAPEVAELLPSAQLAHLEAMVDDPDNHCGFCERPIRGAVANAVSFCDGRFVLVRLAHPECLDSGVYEVPGLRVSAARALQESSGPFLHGRLELRGSSPRAVLLLEPATLFACGDDDPLEVWASGLGLASVSGSLDALAPPAVPGLRLTCWGEELALAHPLGSDLVAAEGVSVAQWWREGEGQALVLMARGLALTRPEPRVAEALRCCPAWAGLASLEAAPSPSGASQLRRFSGVLEKLFAAER